MPEGSYDEETHRVCVILFSFVSNLPDDNKLARYVPAKYHQQHSPFHKSSEDRITSSEQSVASETYDKIVKVELCFQSYGCGYSGQSKNNVRLDLGIRAKSHTLLQ